jgi:alpha-L-fucosidase
VDEAQRLKFLAYYYNRAVAWDKEVVATYKDGFNDNGEVFDFERGGPADLRTPYWLTDDAISSSSWCYTVGIGYYSLNQMLHSLIDRVSKGGNMLLNISPIADGTIPAAQRTVLLGMGDYLRRFGASIYSTRAWTVYGEGPTKMGGGSFTTPRAGTAQDIRFTRSKDNRVLYATVLGWPGSTLTVTTLAAGRINLGTLTSVQLLGSSAGTFTDLPARTQDATGLRITLPSAGAPFSAPAYVVKLTFAGTIPALGAGAPGSGYQRITNVTNGLALDSGGNVAAGSVLKQWSWDGSTNLQWQLVDVGNGWSRIVNRTNGMVIDGYGATTAGASAQQAAWNGGATQQWQLTDRGSGRFSIVNRQTGLVLDSGGSVASGSPVKQWTWDGSTNLQWTFTAL